MASIATKLALGKPLKRSFLDYTGSDITATTAGHNLVGTMDETDYYGAIMAYDFFVNGGALHQDLSLKGTDLLTAGNWALEGVHEVQR